MPENWAAGLILVCLVAYTLSGGADFGGGIWDLFARGKKGQAQRRLIASVLAPIWEANHVWLIAIIVLLFVCFPKAFSTITTALHIPLILMLFGIVLRGTAFVFRSYDEEDLSRMGRWSTTFSIASFVTPFMLGTVLGAVVSEGLRIDPLTGHVATDYISAWLAPFPLCVGLFTASLCAFLAAVYLANEAKDEALCEAFRARALAAAATVGGLALSCYLLAAEGAPLLHKGLGEENWSFALQLLTGTAAVGAIWSLWTRRYPLARVAAMLQVGLIILGLGAVNYPYLIPPDVTISNAASPSSVIETTLYTFAFGSILLVPSFFFLYRVFRPNRP
jgi:cytochrome d ubiquinol oxidase subunit II